MTNILIVEDDELLLRLSHACGAKQITHVIGANGYATSHYSVLGGLPSVTIDPKTGEAINNPLEALLLNLETLAMEEYSKTLHFEQYSISLDDMKNFIIENSDDIVTIALQNDKFRDITYKNPGGKDNNGDKNYPGYFEPVTLIDVVADWTKKKDGISRAGIPIDLGLWFETDEAKENIKYNRTISLEDGSVLGYAEYVKPQSIKFVEYEGDVAYGDETDFAVNLTSRIAESMGLSYYTFSGINYMYFIISKNTERLSAYLANSISGERPDDH